ncbi:hypothetical protein SLEP1_g220 [Rubroshorea leprosula]|uniref:Uncharacterized protein n=1 Tax=Rubroshorea leprosula TaxID=152421 RepID=A0AAV5H9N5_9ROSI|nr:hypothetical protein SLEP1_g220 [Rubroshorea leprosula]
MASPLLSLASRQDSRIPIISASPSSNPLQSPFQELSPDIAPLLPTPGGAVPTTGSSIPTIPSSPSPPNPDDFSILGPDSAFPPSASFPPSSTAPESSARSLNLAAFVLVLSYYARLIA